MIALPWLRDSYRHYLLLLRELPVWRGGVR